MDSRELISINQYSYLEQIPHEIIAQICTNLSALDFLNFIKINWKYSNWFRNYVKCQIYESAFLQYNDHDRFFDLALEAILVQAIKFSNDKLTKELLTKGLNFNSRILNLIRVYHNQDNKSPAFKPLKAQIMLFNQSNKKPDDSVESENIILMITKLSKYLKKGASLNAKMHSKTLIELLALGNDFNIRYLQILLSINNNIENIVNDSNPIKYVKKRMNNIQEQFKANKFEVGILKQPIEKAKTQIIEKIQLNIIRSLNNSIEIIAGQVLLLDTLKFNDLELLKELLCLGVRIIQENLDDAPPMCKPIIMHQLEVNAEILNLKSISVNRVATIERVQ